MYNSFRSALSVLKNCSRRSYSSHANDIVKATTIHDIHNKYIQRTPITMCTAYDFLTAQWVHDANCDMILVGDSLSMTSLGYASTTDLPFDEFKYHVKSVCRAQGSSMVVADMPFGSFEASLEKGISNAVNMMKLSSKVASLKFEVGMHSKDHYTLRLVKEICSRGIPVVGHIGLTPQRVHSLGGYKVQGNKTINDTKELYETAMQLQEAGCWLLVLECVPHKVANYITSNLSIPTIGIGAGNCTSGQVLVISDILGMQQNRIPKFVQRYGHLYPDSVEAIKRYKQDVLEKKFPNQDLHTFKINEELWQTFIADREKQNHE